MTFRILDLEAIEKAALHESPYPFLAIENVLKREVLPQVVESFPELPGRGSFPLNTVACSGDFSQLMEELQRPELRAIIGKRFGMDLGESPPMITVRGHTTERDGHIHTDSKDKLITFLLYLNPNWTSPEGRLRVLYNSKELSPFAAEVSPEAGRCLIFKVTRDCWHGHTVFNGERKSIQLNYVVSDGARNKHLNRHRWSAFLKRLLGKNEAHSPR
jgi:SM-20-related protein